MNPQSMSAPSASAKASRVVAWVGVLLVLGIAAVFLGPWSSSLPLPHVDLVWALVFGGGGLTILLCSVWLIVERLAERPRPHAEVSVAKGRVTRGIGAGFVGGVVGAFATTWMQDGFGFVWFGAMIGLLVVAGILSWLRPRRRNASPVEPESPVATLVALLVFALVYVGTTILGIAAA